MVTIKEVAAAAGVSLGTASNVINGKTNNIELIQKVEEAIKKLDYRPDAKARSLKSAHTFLVGIIVDSLKDYNTRQLLTSLERQFKSKGYSIVIRTSGNNAVLESKNVEYFIQLGVEGIIVSTSLKKKNWLKKLNNQSLPIVFITRSTYADHKMDIINISHKHALQDFFKWCKENRLRKTGFILEMSTISMKELERCAKEYNAHVLYKIVGENSSESGFKAAYELLYENPDLDNLVIGSTMLSKGVEKVLKLKEIRDNVKLICVTPDSWIDNNGVYDGIIEISDYDIGSIASNRLLKKIEEDIVQTGKITVHSAFKRKKDFDFSEFLATLNSDNTVNIALLESETSNVLKMLSELYEKNTGIKINFKFYDYFELWNLIIDSTQLNDLDIDIIMYDILWKDNLIHGKELQDISFLLKEKPEYFTDYIKDILDNMCLEDGKLYGLPFMTGTQLLLYQKDLFEDNLYKIQYKRQYGEELKVPETWEEYNRVAEFFTKSYNDKSPISYGTALINKGNLYNSIDFLNRLWSYDERKVVENQWNYDSNQIKLALKNYKEVFQYTAIEDTFRSWEEVANAFKEGNVAMVVLYDSFAFGINDAMVSKVAGNVGSAVIPGKKPVLGGWGLGIPSCKNEIKKIVSDYLMWSCGPQIGEPFSILSGTSNRKSFYENKESRGLYPWKDQILASYSKSKRRGSIKADGIILNNIKLYDEIIGKALGQYIRGEVLEDDIIKLFESFQLNPKSYLV